MRRAQWPDGESKMAERKTQGKDERDAVGGEKGREEAQERGRRGRWWLQGGQDERYGVRTHQDG